MVLSSGFEFELSLLVFVSTHKVLFREERSAAMPE
jgi:hypothetical protein